MSNSNEEQSSTDQGTTGNGGDGGNDGNREGVTDDKLPQDLRPTDDNPLAKPLTEEEAGEEGMSLDTPDAPDGGAPGAG